jgi:xanthosine utilization system XapX-like protein
MFSDWKTTLTGAIGLVALLVNSIFKLEIPSDVQVAIVAVVGFFVGLFAKDAKKPETPKVTP